MFTALSDDIGVVPAESSVDVPITVTRVAPQSISISDAGTELNANVVVPEPVKSNIASTIYVDYSNTGTVAIPAPLLVLTATQNGNAGGFPVARFRGGRSRLRLQHDARRLQPYRAIPGERGHTGPARAGREREHPRLLWGLAGIPVGRLSGHVQLDRGGHGRHANDRLGVGRARPSARFHQ